MQDIANPIDRSLLDDWQRGFPVEPRPFARLAEAVGASEADVLERLSRMQTSGRITRVGATCAPNTLSASTLAAIAAPEERVEEVAQLINEEPGVNHSYQREDHWNLWFVATGPDRAYVTAALQRIEERTGLQVLDLRLKQPFNVDLGFHLTASASREAPPKPRRIDTDVIKDGDRELMHQLTRGLELVATPYAALADKLGRSEDEVLERIKRLSEARILSRLGVIVRHRALGWTSNAMVVWDVPEDTIAEAGHHLAALPGITLCYERSPVEGIWPYRLYSMIHAKSRSEALSVLDKASALPPLKGVAHKALFSTRCFRQTGAMIADLKEAAS